MAGEGSIDFGRLWWLVEVEAAMKIHRRTYPDDRHWRRWIRRQEMPLEWFDTLRRHARAVGEGKATRFIDPEDDVVSAPAGAGAKRRPRRPSRLRSSGSLRPYAE